MCYKSVQCDKFHVIKRQCKCFLKLATVFLKRDKQLNTRQMHLYAAKRRSLCVCVCKCISFTQREEPVVVLFVFQKRHTG